MSCHPHDTTTGDGGMSNDANLRISSELHTWFNKITAFILNQLFFFEVHH